MTAAVVSAPERTHLGSRSILVGVNVSDGSGVRTKVPRVGLDLVLCSGSLPVHRVQSHDTELRCYGWHGMRHVGRELLYRSRTALHFDGTEVGNCARARKQSNELNAHGWIWSQGVSDKLCSNYRQGRQSRTLGPSRTHRRVLGGARTAPPWATVFPHVTWLILPVVICLFQRLSHACLSIRSRTAKLRMAH